MDATRPDANLKLAASEKPARYLLLGIGACLMLFPFLWMLSTAFKPDAEVLEFPPRWIPSVWQWSNFPTAWHAAPFATYFANSFMVATVGTIGEVAVSALAAYAFASMEFFGRDVLFAVILGSMMVPGEVLLVPNFITVSRLGWMDTYWAIVVPGLVSAFAIFFLRQGFLAIPRELYEAAEIDGCSRFRFFWQVLLPLSRPVLVTSALFKFIGEWNSFLWVLIVTNSPEHRTVAVGLQSFLTDVGASYNLLMAAAALSILPILVLFGFVQRQFIAGIARTGLKG